MIKPRMKCSRASKRLCLKEFTAKIINSNPWVASAGPMILQANNKSAIRTAAGVLYRLETLWKKVRSAEGAAMVLVVVDHVRDLTAVKADALVLACERLRHLSDWAKLTHRALKLVDAQRSAVDVFWRWLRWRADMASCERKLAVRGTHP